MKPIEQKDFKWMALGIILIILLVILLPEQPKEGFVYTHVINTQFAQIEMTHGKEYACAVLPNQ